MTRGALIVALVATVHAGSALLAQDQEQPYKPGPGITIPVPISQVQPKYTQEAMRAQVQGYVVLEGVVRPDGTVTDVRIVKSLDTTYGLDARAIEAAKAWKFKPGLRDGKPVPVIVRFELEFRLHGGPPKPIQGDDAFLNGAYAVEPGVKAPEVKTRIQPTYTQDALDRKIQGIVELELIVGEDGHVARARVKTSLDKTSGLDERALNAVQQWEFEPGQLQDGQKVPVAVTVKIEFRM